MGLWAARFSGLGTADAAGCCGRAENRVGGPWTWLWPRAEGKRVGRRALSSWPHRARVLDLLVLGLVETWLGALGGLLQETR